MVYKARLRWLRMRESGDRFPRAKGVLVEFHVHAAAAKLYTFHGEAKALLCRSLSSQFDLPAGADNPLPRYRVQRVLPQEFRNRPVIKRISCSRSHLAVGGYLPLGNRTNNAAKGCIALIVVAQRILQNSPLEVLRNSRSTHAQNYNKAYCEAAARDN